MYFNEEYTWHQFKNLDNIRRLPLQEQITRYNKYLGELSIQRSLIETYVNQNTFQSFQSNASSAAGSGGEPVTSSFTTIPFVFASTSASACYSASVFPVTVYYMPSSSLQIGHVLYSNSPLTVTASSGFYSNGNGWYFVSSSGMIYSTGSCALVSVPIALGYNVDYIVGSGSACTSASVQPQFNQNYYLNVGAGCSQINIGCALYTNSSLTTFAPSGSYSDGTKFYRVSGSGVVRFSGSCA